MDSDFSIDENDEPVSDNEENEPKRRKRKQVVTRFYKEPLAKNSKKQQQPSSSIKKKSPSKIVKQSKSPLDRKSSHHASHQFKKSLRKSTAAKSAATQHRILERHEAERLKPKAVKVDERMPTQEELLEEAAQTEKENIKSLERFRRMELEKKKVRPTKGTTYTGPIIRYHSMSMPVVQDDQKRFREISTTALDEAEETKRTTRRSKMAASDAAKSINKNRCERTFITFENDINGKAFETFFPPSNNKQRHNLICPVTKLVGKYFDPVTQLPFHNTMAFKIIRESYYQMLENKADQSDAEVVTWLQWRKKQKIRKSIKTEQP